MKKYLLSWNRLAFLYIIFSLLPVIFLSAFSLDTYRKNIESMENTLLDYSGLQTVSNLDSAFKECKQVAASIIADQDVMKYARIFNSPDTSQQAVTVAKNMLYEKISEYSSLNRYIIGTAMLNMHHDSVFITRSPNSIFTESLLNNSEFGEFISQYSNTDYLKEIQIISGCDMPNKPKSNALYFTYPLADLITQEIYGVLLVEFDEDLFLSILLPEQENKIIQSRISNYSTITNTNKKILICPDSSMIGHTFNNMAVADNDYILQTSDIGKTGLSLNLVFFKGPLLHYLSSFQKGLIIYLIIISVLFLFALTLIARRLRKDTVYIENIIRKFRKNPQTPITNIHPQDKLLEAVSSQFNKMSEEISSLLIELEAKNERIKEVAERQKKAELKAMEAQINPHFLYNALDRINWIAIDNEQYEISEMLNGLGSLLRYSLYHIDSVVTLRAELKWMEKYIFIQSKRFGSDIVFSVDVPNTAIDFPIYKMLLQPLVENSILRGFCDNPANQQIRLSASLIEGSDLEIHLSDNGCGMETEQLEKINKIIQSRGTEPTDGVGISNIVSRLSMYYGDNYVLSVKSSPGKGCEFTLRIPFTS